MEIKLPKREIKFRAWIVNAYTQKMIFDKDFKFYDINYPYNEDYTIMQYIGYEDSYETPIYEGDIIECVRFGDPDEYKLYVVIKDIRVIPRMEMFGSSLKERKVIGNIFENKEFLEVLDIENIY